MPPSPFLAAIKETAVYLGKKLDAVIDAIKGLAKSNDISSSVDKQTQVLTRFAERIDSAVASLKNPKFAVSFDTKALKTELEAISREIRGLKQPDLSAIEASLKMIYDCIEEQGAQTTNVLMEGLAEISKTMKNIKVEMPKSITLDDMQMRALTAARAPAIGGGAVRATRVFTYNVSLAAAATQYPFTFPANTMAWEMKLRDEGTLLYYAYVTGKLPTSGDGSNYVTAFQGFTRSADGVDWSNKTIYLGAETDGQVAELTVYLM